MHRLTAVLVSGFAGLGLGEHQPTAQNALWQADLSVRSLTVSEAKGNLTARVVIAADFGEALGARVEVLLPVGVGIVSLGPGCVAGPNVTGIGALRARVECRLGNMAARSNRELFVITTTPPNGVARGFAVVAMSDTPDPKPGNNFVERIIPPEQQEDRIEPRIR
jgi:hypothetical protein